MASGFQSDSSITDEFDNVGKSIGSIRTKIARLKKQQSDILSSALPDQTTKERLLETDNAIRSESKSAKNKLLAIGHQLDKPNNVASSGGLTTLRIHRNQYKMLSEQMMSLMEEYNNLQVAYNETCKARLKRQLHITGVEMEDSQLDDYLINSEASTSGGVFASAVLNNRQAQETLRETQTRHNEIVKLESDIRELHELFLDISVLVNEQGETVDRIEDNVSSAVVEVEAGKSELHDAKLKQSAARKKKLICVILVVVVVIVIAIILGVALS